MGSGQGWAAGRSGTATRPVPCRVADPGTVTGCDRSPAGPKGRAGGGDASVGKGKRQVRGCPAPALVPDGAAPSPVSAPAAPCSFPGTPRPGGMRVVGDPARRWGGWWANPAPSPSEHTVPIKSKWGIRSKWEMSSSGSEPSGAPKGCGCCWRGTEGSRRWVQPCRDVGGSRFPLGAPWGPRRWVFAAG